MSVALWLLLFAFGAQGVSTVSDFTNVTGDSLKARYDSAMSQGRRANADTFWRQLALCCGWGALPGR